METKKNLLMIYSDFYGIWEPYAGLDNAEKQELKKELKRRGVLKHMGHGVYRWKNPVRVVYEVSDEYNEDGGYYVGIRGDDSFLLEDYAQSPDDILYSDDGELGLPTLQELYLITLSNGRVFDFHELLSIDPANGLTFCKEDGYKHEHLINYSYSGLMCPDWFKETYGR